MNYLKRTGDYEYLHDRALPGLILLDLSMPRIDGNEAIELIQEDGDLRSLPIVVMANSDAEADVARAYDLGINSYIVKPITFTGVVDVMTEIGKYWFEIVELPDNQQI